MLQEESSSGETTGRPAGLNNFCRVAVSESTKAAADVNTCLADPTKYVGKHLWFRAARNSTRAPRIESKIFG
jgi:hypothetical protein